MKNIAIIGGGASGIIAALFASKKNNKVTIFEKQNKIGKKILITGNGRCNISNRNINVLHYNGNNPKFVHNVFSKFGLNETIDFFKSIGLPFIEENEGKLFPESRQASSVIEIFQYELSKKKVDVILHKKIETIIPQNKRFKIITAGKKEYIFDSLILAAGSLAYTRLGGSNSGYELAFSLGHKIIKPFPAILPINIPLKIIHTLNGTKWHCGTRVKINKKIIDESKGELHFTKFGISGPAALNISRAVNMSMLNNKKPIIEIDFFPDLPLDELSNKLSSLFTDSNKLLSLSLIGILKKNMPEVLLKIAGIAPDKLIKNISEKDKKSCLKTLKSLELATGQPRSFKEAVIAAGGVNVNEINPSTMESKLLKNLYITGELLDIDGNSGGYNLQFAWSTGAIAGNSQQ